MNGSLLALRPRPLFHPNLPFDFPVKSRLLVLSLKRPYEPQVLNTLQPFKGTHGVALEARIKTAPSSLIGSMFA